MQGLIYAAAVSRVMNEQKLKGRDIRFLRKALDLPSKELADRLEVAQETMSRWENDKAPIGPENEKLLRCSPR